MKKDWFKINKMQLTMIVIYTVLLIAATSCIIIFTPIREYIPGYTDVRLNHRVFDIEQKADSLESVLHQNDVYIRNLKHIINDEDFDDDYIPINIYMEEAPVFMAPLNGMITNRFNYNNKHYGIDIVADIDEVIKTMWNGTVVFADWSAEGGYTIGIQHDKNIFSVYKHNAELLCHEGDIVQTGDPIAIIGNGGSTSTGPHLHFEFWFKGMPLNPEDYITFERK
ncbi:MAG: M23 family metallopeptidase [Bacteroidales bacterium]|nr:M23 family metallopeptidase [Bacteroidales bacterium]